MKYIRLLTLFCAALLPLEALENSTDKEFAESEEKTYPVSQIKIEYDQTVRDPHGNIIQYLYGEDGIDPSKSDHGEAVNISRLIESESVNDNGRKTTEHDVKNILAKYTENLNQRSSRQLRMLLVRLAELAAVQRDRKSGPRSGRSAAVQP